MKRKTFDLVLTAGGAALMVVLVVAGVLLMWGASFANSNVHNQLSEQAITFPPKAAFATAKAGTEITPGMIPYLEQYAGQQLTTGAQAEAYADHFIAIHLQEIGGGLSYAQLSANARALTPGTPAATKAEATVQTVFQGTTLRGLLLEAYAFGTFGQIAFIAGIAAFILAGVMLFLTVLGLWHFRKVPSDVEFPQQHAKVLVDA